MKQLKGIPASTGIAIGKAMLIGRDEIKVLPHTIAETQIPHEIMRFEDALTKTRAQVLKIKQRIADEMGRHHAEIFDAHLMVIEDRTLIEEVINRLKAQKLNVEYIFAEVLKKYTTAFSKIDDEHLRERVADIADVGKRILRNMLGERKARLEDISERVIIVAYDLSPSDTATMHKKNVIAFITDIGGRTSHTAIMAKSLEIPAVVALETATREIQEGDNLIIDGIHGLVYVNPDEPTKNKYQADRERFVQFGQDLLKEKDLPAVTLDGRRIRMLANIEFPEEIPSVIAHGAEGIGLYRTEYLFMDRQDMPTEEEQFASYRGVVTSMKKSTVIIRTLDIGGDKFLSQLEMPQEMNSFLGWRAIRFCLAMPEIFKTQLRAILRASAYGDVKLMYPLISGLEELQEANRVVDEVKKELNQRRIHYNTKIEIGAMIEIPSAAMTCDILAKHTDFFSIGTNDLIQYALAADRVNEKVAYLYEPTHPAVLRLIKSVIQGGHQHKIRVGMCGEMAGDPELAIILLGMGLDELSVSGTLVPEIKRIIRSIKYKQAQKIAQKALTLDTGREIAEYARGEMHKLMKDRLFY